jgi:hypothetical protein
MLPLGRRPRVAPFSADPSEVTHRAAPGSSDAPGRDTESKPNLKFNLNLTDIYSGHAMKTNSNAHGLCLGAASAVGHPKPHKLLKRSICKQTIKIS